MILREGTTLANRYELVQKIGEGGFAVVYRAIDKFLNRQVAVKVVKDARLSEDDLARFQREAKLLGQLTHRNIVSVFAMEQIPESSSVSIVMEFLEGKSLRSLLNEEQKLNSETIMDLAKQICSGLAYAHEAGVVHRDLSTANVFITTEPGGEMTAKLIDFGLSRLVAGDQGPMKTLTETGMIVGNPVYMSPEVIRGEKADKRSDIYALGCIMYECLSGKQAFSADSPMGLLYTHQHDYPEQPPISDKDEKGLLLSNIALRSLQKDPADRFQSCQEIIEVLESQSQTAVLARAHTSWRGAKPMQRRSLVGPSIALAILLLALAFFVLSYEPTLCSLLTVLTKLPVGDAKVEESLASFLTQNRKSAAALIIYKHLDSYYSARNELSSLLSCRLKEAAVCLQARDKEAFNLAMTSVLELLEKQEGEAKNTFALKAWKLLDKSAESFGPVAFLTQNRIFALILKNPAASKSFLNLAFSRTLFSMDKLGFANLSQEQVAPVAINVSAYLRQTRTELSSESHMLNEICERVGGNPAIHEELCKARMDAAEFTGEDRLETMLGYARAMEFRKPDEAYKIAFQMTKLGYDAVQSARAYRLMARISLRRQKPDEALLACNKGLQLLAGDPDSVHYFELLPVKTKALFSLGREKEVQAQIKNMFDMLFGPDAGKRVNGMMKAQFPKDLHSSEAESNSREFRPDFAHEWMLCLESLLEMKDWGSTTSLLNETVKAVSTNKGILNAITVNEMSRQVDVYAVDNKEVLLKLKGIMKKINAACSAA